MNSIVFRTAFTCGLVLLLAGCSEPNPLGRKAISGKVLLDGSPISTGTIEFSPQDPAGVSTGAVIENGAYQIDAKVGVPPGKYIVRIMSPISEPSSGHEVGLAPPGPQTSGPQQPPPATERIPAEYNTRSDKVVEVTEAGPNRFEFDIAARTPDR